jgi:hypothetical protein
MTLSTITVDRRKLLVSAIGLVSATVVTGLAISASPSACWAPDPIYAAIASHREAAQVLDAAHRAAWIRNGYGGGPSISAECEDEIAAISGVIDTLPTSHAGVRALSEYLGEPRSGCIAYMINDRLQEEGHAFEAHFNDQYHPWRESVAFFMARRAAGIDAA